VHDWTDQLHAKLMQKASLLLQAAADGY
jgi:hypothetical protein